MGRVEGKNAVVTGAGGGIGRAIAQALAAEGARVTVADVDERGGRETCEMIDKAGGHASFYYLDVSDEIGWKDIAAGLQKNSGAPTILVNNAGICISAPAEEMTYAAWRRQLAINLDSMFLSTKYIFPMMVAAGGGSIINLSSVAGLQGVPGLTGYCATKGGVRLYTKALALECAYAKNNVRVNSVHPGAIETAIWVKMQNGGDLPDPTERRNSDLMEQARAASVAATPMGRAGQPSDIASGVVYLASDESRFVTGIELVIDGGVHAG
jgi:NAD(P)-dependent dehydrogenase (short-subunit alcohol dehydrogenase family)